MTDAIVADLASPAFLADPYPTYRRLIEQTPVFWLPHSNAPGGMWCVARYDDVMFILHNAPVFKDTSRIAPPDSLTPLDRAMLQRDPPDHTRLRRLASHAFTPRRVQSLEPCIEQMSLDLIARIRERGAADFIADYARPLPIMVIAELLGVPFEDHDRFSAWSDQIMMGSDSVLGGEEAARRSQEAMASLVAYFTALIAQRRQQPRDDLISALIAARDAEDRLSEDELLGMCVLLLIAGHETTVNLIGNGLLTLLRHPDQLALLRQRPEYLTSAIEEMLRYESPVQRSTPRFAAETFEIAGQRIERGQQISLMFGAANRDPAHFLEPDRFDITRHPNPHLGFGSGIHYCLGAPLARIEARVAFSHILEHLPAIRLATDQPEWKPVTWLRGLRRLPVSV
ncbi:MAG: cytochrome P450 [Roseiflexaceae bacterium]|nr:cytochrome P450 [Roseiflexaceae bacterium]